MDQSISKKWIGLVALFAVLMLAFCVFAPQQAYAQQGWNQDNKGWWYEYDAKGHYYKNGWQKITETSEAPGGVQEHDAWYYFGKNGYAKTGWQKSGKHWYFLNDSGKPYMFEMSFRYINGKMYYFDMSGRMATGWCKTHLPIMDRYVWVYANSSGALKTGWLKEKGKWYYLGWVVGGGFNSQEYYAADGWAQVKGEWYYFNASNAMVTGWHNIYGEWYYFASSGAMQKNKWIGNYWLDADGVMATSKWVDGGKYYVDENGKWVKGKKK